MKKTKYFIVLTIAFALTVSACENMSSDLSSDDGSLSKIINTEAILMMPYSEISADVENGLKFMVEEEKLARDVYQYFSDKYSMRVFNNIKSSEQTHMNAVSILLTKYNIENPTSNSVAGNFVNPDLQNLYNKLITDGNVGIIEALKVGAAIEEIDILDLQKHLAELKDNDDIKLVYENLLKGSVNHLKAFVRNLSSRGVKYSLQYLDENLFQSLIS